MVFDCEVMSYSNLSLYMATVPHINVYVSVCYAYEGVFRCFLHIHNLQFMSFYSGKPSSDAILSPFGTTDVTKASWGLVVPKKNPYIYTTSTVHGTNSCK